MYNCSEDIDNHISEIEEFRIEMENSYNLSYEDFISINKESELLKMYDGSLTNKLDSLKKIKDSITFKCEMKKLLYDRFLKTKIIFEENNYKDAYFKYLLKYHEKKSIGSLKYGEYVNEYPGLIGEGRDVKYEIERFCSYLGISYPYNEYQISELCNVIYRNIDVLTSIDTYLLKSVLKKFLPGGDPTDLIYYERYSICQLADDSRQLNHIIKLYDFNTLPYGIKSSYDIMYGTDLTKLIQSYLHYKECLDKGYQYMSDSEFYAYTKPDLTEDCLKLLACTLYGNITIYGGVFMGFETVIRTNYMSMMYGNYTSIGERKGIYIIPNSGSNAYMMMFYDFATGQHLGFLTFIYGSYH